MAYSVKTLQSEDWPELLLNIPKVPEKLFYAGSIPDYSNKFLCVVGSRKYSSYGKEAVSFLLSGLMGYPITIVSGLAMGIDAIAHTCALKNNLPTIAVPGSGLNSKNLHPSSNVNLATEIVERGGTLLSEFEPDFKATQWSFPMRNRIMAGMSHATLIIEAEQKSGTMITARLTTDYNRELLALPGNIFSPMSEGPNMFLRLGATLVRNSEDILEALGIGKMNFDNSQPKEKIEAYSHRYSDCTEDERVIIEIISNGELSRDDLVSQASRKGLDISKIQIALTLLELKGHIEEKLGEIRLV